MEKLASHQPTDTAEDMSKKYANAYFLWTWGDRVIEGQTILSHPKHHDEGMSLFFSTTSALEANCRVKGHIIEELSPFDLYEQYTHMKKESSSSNGSTELIKIAEILKGTGAVELNPEGIPTKRCTISDYKVFDAKTPESLSEALDHLRMHGPLVAVYPVTEYQRRNEDSFGILHGAEEQVVGVCQETDGIEVSASERTVCVTGFGVEDSCSFLQFQKFRRVQEEKGMFGRVLASSTLELVGFFVEAPTRC